MPSNKQLLSKLPSTHKLLTRLTQQFPHFKSEILKVIINEKLDEVRANPEAFKFGELSREEIERKLINLLTLQIDSLEKGTLHKVINATGVVLHTNLGRAPLNTKWIDLLKDVSGYCNLELDLNSGNRGQRNDHLSYLLHLLTGAEDGFAVNNNAAAVMLMLNTLGYQKEVILSRGEMIEIGGSFRMPEVMKASGCVLREIGATNKTHLKDYLEAINENTGAILICHPSNYEIQGFTHKPALEEIVSLAHEHNLPVIYDLGSGSMPETSHLAGAYEPEVQRIVEAGVDLISFSGDKLLGGPQAGIIVGKKEYVQRCAKNHLLRALRLDKLMIRLLQIVLSQYLYNNTQARIPAHTALLENQHSLKKRCERFLSSLSPGVRSQFKIEKMPGKVGSGAYPLLPLPGMVLKFVNSKIKANQLARQLRLQQPPIVTYVEDDQVVIDLRTVLPEEESLLKQSVEKALQDLI